MLLTAVTLSCRRRNSVKQCEYEVRLRTGGEKDSGTDDNIKIRIREDRPWHNLDNARDDDFEVGYTDTFKFEDDCVDRHQQTTIGSAGQAKFGICFSNAWLVTHVTLMCFDGAWINSWSVYKWIWCHDKLELPKISKYRRVRMRRRTQLMSYRTQPPLCWCYYWFNAAHLCVHFTSRHGDVCHEQMLI